jgi:hypothetical protein
MVEAGPFGVNYVHVRPRRLCGAGSPITGVMNIIILSLVCIAVIGICVAVFLRFVTVFNKKYDEFEDERHRAVVGTLHGKKLSEKHSQ